jgi:RNA polymerase I specific transcription initiation factor RRN3
LPSVAQEFARVTHKLSLLRCKHLLADSMDASAALRTSGRKRTADLLDSFFPFDPYLLRDSSSFIDGVYITWEDRVAPLERGFGAAAGASADRLALPRGCDIAGSHDSFGSSYGSASYGTSPAVKYLVK